MPDRPSGSAELDVLTDVLIALQLRAWLYSRTEITSPWRFEFTASPDSSFHIIGSGGGYLLAPDAVQDSAVTPVPVSEGDVIVFPHGDAHAICDAPGSPLTNKVSLEYDAGRAHQIFPFAGDGRTTVMLCGAFRLDRTHRTMLDSLPRFIHIPAADGGVSPDFADIVALIETESRSGRPGAQSVLRRLTEILFIQVIRAWLDQPQHSRGWLVALTDPTIGQALSLIHQHPEHRWNVRELADAVALSRSTFSARFTELVGQPPMKYLTHWRMHHASRLLTNGASISGIANHLGYDSEVAFRKAFTREIGTPPGKYRQSEHTRR
jgi:AraC-like DNA-binding protein